MINSAMFKIHKGLVNCLTNHLNTLKRDKNNKITFSKVDHKTQRACTCVCVCSCVHCARAHA